MKKLLFIFIILTLLFSLNIFADTTQNEKKRVVFVKDDDGEFFNSVAILINNLLIQKGWSKENFEYIVFSIKGKESTKREILNKIRELKPDVVLMNTVSIKDIGIELKQDGIPVVASGGLELKNDKGELILVDKNGFPTTNITGLYTLPSNHLKNSFMLLKKIAPLNGKKVVFATLPSGAFTEDKVKKSLDSLNIQLKDFKEFTYIEDYQEFVKKYNDDPEVGWIISGKMITRKKNGENYSFEEFFKWERENLKKPNIGFWEVSAAHDKLCALGIDSKILIGQMVNMADRILKGEKVSNIKVENPAKTLIILNQKRAEDIGIKFGIDIIGAAWKIYTDYEGNFISRE